jgi:hypothetical protein
MSYKTVRKELADQAVDEKRAPCTVCSTPTLRETLTQYGARCFSCYEAYTREQRTFPDVGSKHQRGPRDWAHALKRRHDAGEQLTPAQISAYRATLREAPQAQSQGAWE